MAQSRENGQTLESGTLWSKVLRSTEHAINRGALHCIPTRYEFVPYEQVDFLVRIIEESTARNGDKKSTHKEQTEDHNVINPFLPYEPDLFVANLSESHIAILNKFNVVDHHLLVITRSFEHQDSLLTLRDFQAVWTCLAEYDGLAFYNSGPASGSSQPHKHLQFIPLPIVPGGLRIPTESLITADLSHQVIERSPSLPFAHAVTRTVVPALNSARDAAGDSLERYLTMLRALGLQNAGVRTTQVSGPYNLLITREWMLLVPRREEYFDSISINALGFAGAFLVRNVQQMQALRRAGPMKLLQHTTKPW